MQIPDLTDLFSVPYKINGRSLTGLDCYGLCIEVSKRFGFYLPDSKELEEINRFVKDKKLAVVKDYPKTSDILLFFDSKNRMTHVGIYLSSGNFIHCCAEGVKVCKLENFYIAKWKVLRWL